MNIFKRKKKSEIMQKSMPKIETFEQAAEYLHRYTLKDFSGQSIDNPEESYPPKSVEDITNDLYLIAGGIEEAEEIEYAALQFMSAYSGGYIEHLLNRYRENQEDY